VQIIDSLQASIRNGCFVADFVAQMKKLISQAQDSSEPEESKEQRKGVF
jgi:hypothetical protein